MILAGDIGGTKTLLGLFRRTHTRPIPVHVHSFVTLGYDGLVAMLREFLDRTQESEIEAASFGVAGPVRDRVAHMTNVPWTVDADLVAGATGIQRVTLLNDLESMAYSVPVLDRSELEILQDGRADPMGNAALIAAGTGLGEAHLANVQGKLVPSPSEGGHADFSARTEEEFELTRFLTRRYGRAEWEQVISGTGLPNLYDFTHPERCDAVSAAPDDPKLPAEITAAALERRCPQCERSLRMFVSAYGAEAGNLALRSLATGGVYLGGGIAPKILPALTDGSFMEAFRAKSPMHELLAALPVRVIMNPQAALIGAAVRAATP